MPETDDRSGPSRLPGLDLLRLLAVAAVVFYHYGFWGPAAHGVPQVALPSWAPSAQYGFLGVPVFFVISGFVIAYSAEGRTPTGFIIARFSRIYPTFLVCMSLTFAAIFTLGTPHFDVSVGQWFANLLIAAPALGEPYVDTSYWSLVIEVTFYAWVALLMAFGLLPRRIDAIILVWMAITFANELTVDKPIFEKLFMADDSGFFAVGLLIYEHYRGRRDARLAAIFALAVGTAVFQAVHKLERLGVHTHGTFDSRVVAAICLISIALVFVLTRIKRVPLPAAVVLGAGGITYPLYLLHMQLGYVLFMAIGPTEYAGLCTAAIIFGAVLLAWIVWRFVERPAHRWTRDTMTEIATRLGWPSRPSKAPSIVVSGSRTG